MSGWGIYYDTLELLNLFCLTYASTILIENSQRISETVYNFEWYNHPPTMRKIFVLIMIAAQKQHAIKAALFLPVTLELFTVVSFVSYLNLLSFMQSWLIPNNFRSWTAPFHITPSWRKCMPRNELRTRSKQYATQNSSQYSQLMGN